MFVVALTGGIGSGKTAVSDQLAKLGAGIIDTDLLSRELTAPGTPTLASIFEVFGKEAALPDGSLNRAYLRARVFQDPDARNQLESILHPAIRALMLERLATISAPYVVLVIPLLFETGQQRLADRVLVVDIPEAQQIERVRHRSGLSGPEIERILASQASRQQRLAGADDVIDNSGPPSALAPQVEQFHQGYLRLAKNH
ncbi:dephospho-CoA kinase [Thiorhodococcus mannitoliphagus]|uniref:Dephospho-CoA kinase n=1 Tax=Thiorhodococcus mannitoliphagus TaxID=329406 RepID=A0A6P1DQW2_9GAMM|nr:dephospho-CoA kinase [Thiorhodococcus mannitoliphagus]NEX19321.1 dephospho-CoA kinase [Thiorhodococcus mannitoliphagus]